MQEDPRDQPPANGIQLLTWVLSDDRRTSRAIRLILATAAWTAPPAVVIGVLIGVSGDGAGLLISIAALVTMTITIGAAVWMLRFQLRGERKFTLNGLVSVVYRRFRRSIGSTGTGRHALPTQWADPRLRTMTAPPPMGTSPMAQAG